MSEEEFNKIFSRRLRHYLNEYEMTQADLAKQLNVGTTSVYNWCNAIKTPRMDKVDAMCKIFNCKRSDLIEERADESATPYYLNDETRQIAQEIYDNPDMRSLFDMSRKMTPERLKAHVDFMKQLYDAEHSKE